MWLGEFSAGDTIDWKFTTRATTGIPTALAAGVVSVYKDNGTTESTAGLTLTASFDSVVGLNHVRITTASDGTFYANGSDFQAVITTGTVGGVSVVGEVVGHFTIRNRASLKPTVAGRALDVSAGGEAGLDWANVGSPTTTLVLSGTTVGVVTLVNTLTTYTGDTPQTGNVFALANGASGFVAIAAKTTNLPADPAGLAGLASAHGAGSWATATSVTVSDKTGFSLAAAGLDLVVVETGLNARQALSVIAAACGGVLSGAATTTVVISGAGVATARVTATVDASGNRSSVLLAPPT